MLKSMRMGTKILLSFAVALALALVIGAVGYITADDVTSRLNDIGDARMPSLDALWTVNEAQTDAARNMNALMLPHADAALRQSAKTGFEEALKRIDDKGKVYEALPHHAETLALWKDAMTKMASWRKLATQTVALSSDALATADKDGKAWASFLEARSAYAPGDEALRKAIEKTQKDSAESSEAAHAASRRGIQLMVITLLVGAGLLIGVGIVLSRSTGRTVGTLVSEASKLRDAVAAGKLDVRGDVAALDQEFRPIVEGINETMDAFARPIEVTADYVTRISNGDIPPAITDTYLGDFNKIKEALNRCVATVNALVSDAGMLAKAGVEGHLATRADASKHLGDFRKVVQGVNDTLDAVIGPLNVAAKYVDQISKGQIPEKITDSYNGDFNTIKDNLNRCIDAVNRLVSDAGALAQAGVEGRLATRADAAKHEGDFRKIVDGVNRTLDAVIGPLNVAAKYVDQISKGEIPEKITDSYAGDFNTIKNNLNTCIEAINLLVADAGKLVEAAVAGELSTRADASRHQGDFRQIVDGVNKTLDAVMAPINEAAQVLEQLSQRDSPRPSDGPVPG